MSNTDAADRLKVRYATLKLTPTAADDLYAVLDAARDKVRKVTPGEDPKASVAAAFQAGFAACLAAGWVPSNRRGQVLAMALDWMPDVVAVTDEQYRLTLGGWSMRAKAAREDNAAAAFKPRARA